MSVFHPVCKKMKLESVSLFHVTRFICSDWRFLPGVDSITPLLFLTCSNLQWCRLVLRSPAALLSRYLSSFRLLYNAADTRTSRPPSSPGVGQCKSQQGMKGPHQLHTQQPPRTTGSPGPAGKSCWSLDVRVVVLLVTLAGAVILLLLYRLLQLRHRFVCLCVGWLRS